MYVVIMGAGRVGLTLANYLVTSGNDVTVIESNNGLCSEAAANLDALIICGNGTNTKTLEDANISDADVFVAATGFDEANLLSCILVKDYDVSKIIARVSNPDHEEAFKKVGIDYVISPELTAAGYLEKLINRPKIADLIVVGKGNAELLDISIQNSRVVGKCVGDLSPTDDYIIAAIHQNGEMRIPHDDWVLKKDEKISVLVKTTAVKKVTSVFI
ncbi:potassium channel family protein [Methanobacterium petrolearium]|uniref:potassium channel family protein n=1 Tax=Methanobacterium petrolearium TaxID=710190 RepID=UPI001AE3DE3C|nr:TrkA family potassium uptake protein [Methanobacterium petrolearium]MBP1946106.1 trk system potassium uptake protein TrkA [Methanobacterium petrolearium]BDZ70753.1 potassium transporter TrkA [Methanobacterium petrolearium]